MKKSSKSFLDLVTLAILFVCIGCKQSIDQNTKEKPTIASLIPILEQVYDEDQKIRYILLDSIGLNAPEAPYYKKEMLRIDSINQIKVTAILDRHGWIHRDSIGQKASDALFYTIQHSDNETINKYFPMLKAMAAKGGANKKHTAMMEDRILMRAGKKQIYGTQARQITIENKKIKIIWPIAEPDKVNELRKEAGFSTTIEEYAARMNADFDPDASLPVQ